MKQVYALSWCKASNTAHNIVHTTPSHRKGVHAQTFVFLNQLFDTLIRSNPTNRALQDLVDSHF